MLSSVSLANYCGILKDKLNGKKALVSFCLEIIKPKWKIKRDVSIFDNFPKMRNVLINDLYLPNTFTLALARGQALISNTAMYNFYDIKL